LWQVLRSLRVPGAWLGAALWALHPVAVESVAWITEMKNTESALFFLLSILFFVRWLRAKELGGRAGSGWSYALSLLFAALAMASKSSTVILPVILCLCAWWIECRWDWRHVARVVPVFLMSAAASALSIWTQVLQLATVPDPQWSRTWPQRLATAGDAVWFYLGKLIWPHPLIAIYPRWRIDAVHWVSYLPLLAVIVIFAILWFKRQLWSRACFFAFAYFVVALLPVLGLFDNFIFRYSFVFDHFQYLASIGPLALAGAVLARSSDFVIPKRPWLRSAFCAGLLLSLGLASWQRTWVYEGQETLWSDTVAKNPDCWIGHGNLGASLLQKGQLGEAIDQFQITLEINPNLAEVHSNLGLALFRKGAVDDAVAQYRKAVEIDPSYATAHYNLGLALSQKGQLDEAAAQYQKTVEIDPNYALAHYDLGNTLFTEGQLDEAIAQYQKAVEIDPNYATAHYNLGTALFQKGEVDDAVIQFKKAVEISPNFAEAHYDLGLTLAQKGQLDEAVAEYQKTVEIKPGFAEAHYNLGNAFGLKGQFEDAITQFEEALRLKPGYTPAKVNLEKAQALLGQKEGNN
jgi:protein O-mannosyl-transferase